MDRHERLYEQYEDALFALLLDQVAQEEGARLLEENERLLNDPDAAVPEELDRKSREAIRRAFGARSGPKRARHTVGWYLGKIAVFILAALLVFITVYAISPSVRLYTLNALIDASDVSSRLSVVQGAGTREAMGAKQDTLAGYALPGSLSRSYDVIDQGENQHNAWIMYSHPNGTTIRIHISDHSDGYLDSENATDSKEIEVNKHSALLIEKDNAIRISWHDDGSEKYIYFSSIGIDTDKALSYVGQIVFVG